MGLDWHLVNKEDGTTPRQHIASVIGLKPGADEGVVEYLVHDERWKDYYIFSELRNTELTDEEVRKVVSSSGIHFTEAWVDKPEFPTDAIAWVTGICCGDFDFRGKVVSRSDLLSDRDEIVQMAYYDMTPTTMVDLGTNLHEQVCDWLQERFGIAEPQTEEARFDLLDDHNEYYHLLRAARWLMFWGRAGFSMSPSY